MTLNMEKMTFENIIGDSSEIRKAVIMARKAAAVDLPVLITGETGTAMSDEAKLLELNNFIL